MQQNVKPTNDSDSVINKPESAANQQIASLLLNLASRSQQQGRREAQVSAQPEAMDLTKYRKPPKLQRFGEKRATEPAKTPSSASSFYSSMSGLGSPFLLQNLLMQQMGNSGSVVGQAGMATTIPLMAGQIVAQLNSLLFAMHGVQDKGVELNVQGQLGAIYTRLQEIVTMIQHCNKKVETTSSRKQKDFQPASNTELQKQLELVTSTKEAEEQRISAQLEEYQRALAGSTAFPATSSPRPGNVASIIRSQKPMDDIAEPQEEAVIKSEEQLSRRGSRDSLEDGAPPEKRAREEEASSPATSPQSGSRGGARSGKGGKGIRNRVFCGDCAGCLKNDDCGSCRYCR